MTSWNASLAAPIALVSSASALATAGSRPDTAAARSSWARFSRRSRERVDPRRGALGGEALELGAQLVDLLHLAAGGSTDDRTAVRAQRYQAGALELGQRLTDGGATDLEAGAQLVLGETFAEGDPAVEDVALQAMGDVVGEAGAR